MVQQAEHNATGEQHRREGELKHERERRGKMFHLPNFNLDTAFHYYAIMRLISYVYESSFSDLGRKLTDYTKGHSKVATPVAESAVPVTVAHSEKSSADGADSKASHDFIGVMGGETKKTQTSPVTVPPTSANKSNKQAPIPFSKRFSIMDEDTHVRERAIRNTLSVVEAASFMAWTAYNFVKERKDALNCYSSVVAAETGQDATKMDMSKLGKTENPLVTSVLDKFYWQNISRAATDSLFLVGLKHGIIGKAIGITLERSVFFNKTAVEQLRDIVDDAKWNNLGADGKNDLRKTFVKVAQLSCKENHLTSLTEAEVTSLKPAFEKLAERVMEKKFGFAEVVYVMGNIIVHPDKPLQAMQDIENIDKGGLAGIAAQKREQLGLKPLPPRPQTKFADHDPENTSLSPSIAKIIAGGRKGLMQGAPIPSIQGKGIA